jgi:hypothetical protein
MRAGEAPPASQPGCQPGTGERQGEDVWQGAGEVEGEVELQRRQQHGGDATTSIFLLCQLAPPLALRRPPQQEFWELFTHFCLVNTTDCEAMI